MGDDWFGQRMDDALYDECASGHPNRPGHHCKFCDFMDAGRSEVQRSE